MKLLKFYTDTCIQCKQLNKNLEGITGVTIVPINCENDLDAVKKYNIRSVPSMVLLDEDNNPCRRMIGVYATHILQEIINQESENNKVEKP